jgi:hypothetical protein
MMTDALWPMATRQGPPTFDFFNWLVDVKKWGVDRVVIDDEIVRTAKFPETIVRQRIESIIWPGPALAKLPVVRGKKGMTIGNRKMDRLLHGKFPRLTSVLPPRKDYRYTVTLRNYQHHPGRNSDLELWRMFAKEIGAYVFEDFADQPIHLHDRVAICAGAEMNFGVTNGPVWLLFLTPYPVTMFDCAINASGFNTQHVPTGGQPPWALPNQRLVWERPTMDNLLAAVPR